VDILGLAALEWFFS
jgi:hypothetical protein